HEELLGQVLGILGVITLSADVSVEGIPVGAAQFLQGFPGLWRLGVACREHHAPVRRWEYAKSSSGFHWLPMGHAAMTYDAMSDLIAGDDRGSSSVVEGWRESPCAAGCLR